MCPHSEEFDPSAYEAVVADLIRALDTDATPLRSATAERLAALARHDRFEEAARCRDAWRRLATSLERDRSWTSLVNAGTIVARRDGVNVEIHEGRLLGAWRDGHTRPLAEVPDRATEHPTSMAQAEEARLVWTWLGHPDTDLISVSGELAQPPHPVPTIDSVTFDADTVDRT